MNKLPDKIWCTSLERAAIGFNAQVENAPQIYCTREYLLGLIEQEKAVNIIFTKLVTAFLILNTVALTYIQGVKLSFTIYGNQIPEIPATAEILCFLIGLNVFGLSLQSLNIITLSRMRHMIIVKSLDTDLPNMSMAHVKGDGVWIDAITSKYMGYQSGRSHNFVSHVMLFILLGFHIALFFAAGTALIATYKFGLQTNPLSFDWATVVSWAGLIIGFSGIALFVVMLFVPFPFYKPKD